MRALVRLDGPSLLGEGTVGGLRLELPGLLWASGPKGMGEALPAAAPRLETLASPGPMRRAFRLVQGGTTLDLAFSVPTPEVSGGEAEPAEAAPRVLLVRTPLSSTAKARLQEDRWDLVVWSNARAEFTRSEGFVRAAISLRECAGPAPLLWAPRIATPGRMAFLHGLGIDLLDTTEGCWAAAEGAWISADHEILDESPLEEDQVPGPEEGELARRVRHAELEYAQEAQRVRRALRAGRLRELIESRLVPEPRRGELLRYFDRAGYGFQESHAPVSGSAVRPYTTREALRRPEVERFRRRFLERYTPPPFRPVLLLVPCSQTKPYANSPTHRRFARALEGIPGAPLVHTVSVTSPLGLVPRELECLYPARNYDIPVTGDWDEDERRWVLQALRHLLEKGAYASVVVHLPREEYAWAEPLLPPSETVRWTVVEEGTTSKDSLHALSEAARSVLERDPPRMPPGGMLRVIREDLHRLAQVQFGPALSSALFEGEVRLAGRPWFQRLVYPERQDLATWREETGLWRLTIAGARKVLGQADGFRVEARGGMELKGDLFAPGVLRADPDLRIGDEAILVRQGEIVGVGEARVPGPWMGRLPRGLVVKIRHRAHGQGETTSSPTGEESDEPARRPAA